MRVPCRWLRDYVEVGLDPDELAEALTGQGLAVDAVERPAPFAGVVVGRVLAAEPHPNADRLKLCRVDVGDARGQDDWLGGPRPIVCGAPNVAAGQLVPVALPGARLPGGMEIGVAKLRGVESRGMICSAGELGLPAVAGAPERGILVLPEGLAPGQDAVEALGLEEGILVLDLTPNYATHCQSMIGVAREVAALTGGSLRLPEARLKESGGPAAAVAQVRIEAPDLCARYVARVIRGVRIGPSPLWMQRRLEAAGMRPINNVVDITNYVMLEYGQPLHAFDLHRLRGERGGPVSISVRRAGRGERMLTLDGQERELLESDLVIADGGGAVAVAGVMGGLHSEVVESTTDILLESAHFDPLSVRRTGRRLGLRSESSARFEKWVDPAGCAAAAARAAALMQELAGGQVLEGAVDVYPRPAEERVVSMDPARVNGLLGTDLRGEEMASLLSRLGLPARLEADGMYRVTIPSRRPDIDGEADLAEEVARLHGYNQIPLALPDSPPLAPAPDGLAERLDSVKELCLAAGFHEVVTYSFMDPQAPDRLGLAVASPERLAIPVVNPLVAEQGVMRTTLLPLLLDTAAANARRHHLDLALFEVGRVYLPTSLPLTELPREPARLGLLAMGHSEAISWLGPAREADFFVLKGVVEALLERFGLKGSFQAGSHPAFHPGRTAVLMVDGQERGILGEVHPRVREAWQLPARLYLAELDLEGLLAAAPAARGYRPLPRYPANARDLAFALPRVTPAAQVEALIREAGAPLLADVSLFDVYEGEHVETGWRSLAYALVYRAADRTLTDAEVEEVHDRVRQALADRLGARLRS